jgi:hypothetical protein
LRGAVHEEPGNAVGVASVPVAVPDRFTLPPKIALTAITATGTAKIAAATTVKYLWRKMNLI